MSDSNNNQKKNYRKRNVNDSLTDDEARRAEIERLRVLSERRYFDQRVEKKVKEVDEFLRDSEFLFADDELTETEKRIREIDRKIFEIAKRRKTELVESEEEIIESYKMPETGFTEDGKIDKKKREMVLKGKYNKSIYDKKEARDYEHQDEWEESQLTKIQAGKKLKKKPKHYKEYDLILDEIDFNQDKKGSIKGIDIDFLEKKLKEQEEAKALSSKSRFLSEYEQLQEVRRSLPIYAFRKDLMKAIEDHQVIVVVGETGSGKTTQIPQYLYEEGYCKRGKIGCTQPRRVAAMSVSERVAKEMNVELGHEVGYSIRFEDATNEKTIIKYMTDGMLVREFLSEPDLASYSALIIDEAHERTLNTDILFGLIKDVGRYRPELKIIIASATLDANKFAKYFDDAPIFKIPGRRFPVDIFYTAEPQPDYCEAAVNTALQIHLNEEDGDILIFLTGQEEVENVAEALISKTKGKKLKELIVCKIYSSLPKNLQSLVFKPTPPNARKVIVATNIAETSLTIDGVRYVIDSGFCKQNSYNPRTGMESLLVTPISKASAEQRAGRAGRTAPGKCYRLFTKHSFMNELEDGTLPEIQRSNLSTLVLLMKSLGIDDIIHFDFMDAPPAETLIKALELLYALGALNDKGELTRLGRRMAELPIDPMLSKMLFQAEKYGCGQEILSICAMLSAGNAIFYRPKENASNSDIARKSFFSPYGDHLTLLNVYKQWENEEFSKGWCYMNYLQFTTLERARDIRQQLENLLEKIGVKLESNEDDLTAIRKCICAGYFAHTAQLQKNGEYKAIKQKRYVKIHPSSALFKTEMPPKWLVYHELVLTKEEYMREVTMIEQEWLFEVAPYYFTNLKKETKQIKIKGKKRDDTM